MTRKYDRQPAEVKHRVYLKRTDNGKRFVYATMLSRSALLDENAARMLLKMSVETWCTKLKREAGVDLVFDSIEVYNSTLQRYFPSSLTPLP